MNARDRTKLCLMFFLSGSVATILLFAVIVGFARYAARCQQSSRHDLQAEHRSVPPCGLIEALEIPLPYPEGVLPDGAERLRPPKWCFRGFTGGRIVDFLNTCDLRPAQRRMLLSPKYCRVTPEGCVVTPPETLIWSLNSRARRQIYSALATSQDNYAQRFPLRYSSEGFAARLAASGLTECEAEQIRRLVYTDSGTVCFTDLGAVREALPPGSFDRLIEALYEVPAFSLRLHVTPDSDVDALVKYWGKGGREKQIRPLLKALLRVPGGAAINVSCLLPPFPRSRLYTYPDSWDDPTASRQDCFFTALNFFNTTPNTNFLDSAYCQKFLDENYTAVVEEPAYGDIMLLIDSTGKAIHTSVYIAEDFVFTKNGVTPLQPWILMRMDDMLSVYFGPGRSGRMLLLRSKNRA